jgi:predicted AAA+ superfamily ATPase
VLPERQILRQNPWWTQPGWVAADPHLDRLRNHPVRLPADFAATLDLESPGIHVLRGPRQVGKSTELKLLVQRALETGRQPRRVTYLALDLLEGQGPAALAASVRLAKELAGLSGPSLLLLDEVTAVGSWQTAIKSLWDDGDIRHDVVVCTGSSAIDLQRGAAERLPGRREAGRDHLALPHTFGAFACATDPSIPLPPSLTVSDLRSDDGEALLHDARLHAPALERAFRRYLRFGGLPAAVADAVAGAPEPSDATTRVMYDSLVGELRRKGASTAAGNALVERVVRSLGSKTNWSLMAREMDVPLGSRGGPRPSYHTLRDYLETLVGGYFLFVVYFWRTGSDSNAQSKDKKVYFADPLLHSLALELAPGLQPNLPALVENAIGLALYRRYEPAARLIESFVLPERLHIWQTARGGEINFVCGPRRALDVVEVKYSDDPGLRAVSAAAAAHPGRPVLLATKSVSHIADAYTLLPAHTLAWALS